jgi:hypothetical protein
MKYLLILLLSLTATGCAYQKVNMYDYYEATQLCMKSGNSDVIEITIYFNGAEGVRCSNNEQFTLHTEIIK